MRQVDRPTPDSAPGVGPTSPRYLSPDEVRARMDASPRWALATLQLQVHRQRSEEERVRLVADLVTRYPGASTDQVAKIHGRERTTRTYLSWLREAASRGLVRRELASRGRYGRVTSWWPARGPRAPHDIEQPRGQGEV